MSEIVKKNILGVDVSAATKADILEYIFASVQKKDKSYYVVTPNPEIIIASRRDNNFREILNKASLSLCDGVGLFRAAKFLKKPLPERITGTDLVEDICKESVRKTVNIGFLGGRDGVAEKAVECLERKLGPFNILFIGEEWGEEGFANARQYQVARNMYHAEAKEALSHNTKYKIHNTDVIDILFVAFGFPKQEKWMAEHLEKGSYKVAIGVGGAFDYLSGSVSRAPSWIRSMGLEWLYRLIRQPWRWKRQLALLEFISLVIKEKFS